MILCVFLYLTDPLNNDTDSDGFLDGDEVVNGTDPLDPDDFPSLPQQLTLPRGFQL
ncbi:MAG: thrombospondin type 3 repeat-containing protein [Candidatus Heimdallarchaeota archaeon]|nr:thrombospondin type 3 repeat-containing protein [Candidatus Heimdallarchaeota archaeon]